MSRGGRRSGDGADEARRRAAGWAWVIWAVGLAAHAAMIAAAALVLEPASGGIMGGGFGWAVLALAIAVVGGTFARGEIFKRYWVGEAIAPTGYLLGHVAAWGSLALAAGVALGICLSFAALWPSGIVLLIALVMHALMWPRSSAMLEQEPEQE